MLDEQTLQIGKGPGAVILAIAVKVETLTKLPEAFASVFAESLDLVFKELLWVTLRVPGAFDTAT